MRVLSWKRNHVSRELYRYLRDTIYCCSVRGDVSSKIGVRVLCPWNTGQKTHVAWFIMKHYTLWYTYIVKILYSFVKCLNLIIKFRNKHNRSYVNILNTFVINIIKVMFIMKYHFFVICRYNLYICSNI